MNQTSGAEAVVRNVTLALLVCLTLISPACVSRNSIHRAADEGDYEAVDRLLKRNPKLANQAGYPPSKSCVEWVIRLEYKAEGISDFPDAAPIHFAAQNGHKHVVELLVENGADVNAVAEDGSTPLFMAVESHHHDIAQLLLDSGARHTVHTASATGAIPDLTAILEKHPKRINSGDWNDDTPLHWAVSEGQEAVINLLLEKGAQLDARNGYAETPLHIAATLGKTEIAKMLLEHGADVNAKGSFEQTPLHFAAGDGYTELVEVLLSHGADVNVRDDYWRYTPLHNAVRSGEEEVVKLLLEHGADVGATDGDGRTSEQTARLKGYREIVELLREYGQK